MVRTLKILTPVQLVLNRAVALYVVRCAGEASSSDASNAKYESPRDQFIEYLEIVFEFKWERPLILSESGHTGNKKSDKELYLFQTTSLRDRFNGAKKRLQKSYDFTISSGSVILSRFEFSKKRSNALICDFFNIRPKLRIKRTVPGITWASA